MQERESYMKDTEYFLNKIKNINAIPENATLVTADVVVFIQVYHIKLVSRHSESHWVEEKHMKYLQVNSLK